MYLQMMDELSADSNPKRRETLSGAAGREAIQPCIVPNNRCYNPIRAGLWVYVEET